MIARCILLHASQCALTLPAATVVVVASKASSSAITISPPSGLARRHSKAPSADECGLLEPCFTFGKLDQKVALNNVLSDQDGRLSFSDEEFGFGGMPTESKETYERWSPVEFSTNVKTPLLIMFGENDGTVFWHQGIEVYNIARRAKKDVVLLAYAGEDHGLRKKANQIDYQRRILQWFGHYLKSEPAAPWITSGVSFLEREAELKRRKKT